MYRKVSTIYYENAHYESSSCSTAQRQNTSPPVVLSSWTHKLLFALWLTYCLKFSIQETCHITNVAQFESTDSQWQSFYFRHESCGNLYIITCNSTHLMFTVKDCVRSGIKIAKFNSYQWKQIIHQIKL